MPDAILPLASIAIMEIFGRLRICACIAVGWTMYKISPPEVPGSDNETFQDQIQTYSMPTQDGSGVPAVRLLGIVGAVGHSSSPASFIGLKARE